MRVACVGGGPGGLFFATLLKRALPSAEVTVHERNRRDDTFGFGVVFSDATLDRINAADPVLRDGLAAHGVHWDRIEMRARGQRWACGGNGMAAISRRTLLLLLQERAIAAGVDLRFEDEVDPAALLDRDLVVGSDGANSQVRALYPDVLVPEREQASLKFIWFGTRHLFDGLTFLFRRSEHGAFAVHGYPIGPDTSTFIVETEESAWRAAGLDGFDVDQPPGPSDMRSFRYLEELFAEDIGGAPLLANNSRWGNFRTLKVSRWHHRNVVLLGDAAHTAHFSVGSGTKMAMEDAISLADAIVAHPEDIPSALAAYEAAARPSVDHIQGAAAPSLLWWERFPRYVDALEDWRLPVHFLTRSITLDRLGRRDPAFVAQARAAWREQHGADPLDAAITLGGEHLPSRALPAVGPEGATRAVRVGGKELPVTAGAGTSAGMTSGGPWVQALTTPGHLAELPVAVDAARRGREAGAVAHLVSGGSPELRPLLAEELRFSGLGPVILDDPALTRPEVETLILTGRTDLVVAHPAAEPTP